MDHVAILFEFECFMMLSYTSPRVLRGCQSNALQLLAFLFSLKASLSLLLAYQSSSRRASHQGKHGKLSLLKKIKPPNSSIDCSLDI